MKRYLVTGGAGFIGSHIVRALLEQGEMVRVLDNFSSGKRENLEGLSTAKKNANRFEVVEGDVRNESVVADAVRDVEVIFHEAAFVSVPESMEKPQTCFDVNITGWCAPCSGRIECGGVWRPGRVTVERRYAIEAAFTLCSFKARRRNVCPTLYRFIWIGGCRFALFQRVWPASAPGLDVCSGGADLYSPPARR
jgi:NAD(P)-dependent dehydrogenase (short-subunit alcohol dehydrogenase family)